MSARRTTIVVNKIISGGQTGVDRAALDVAIRLGIAHGGWCPRGRRAEDGRIPDRYRLLEHASPRYAARTEANVLDSNGTLILTRGAVAGGTELTRQAADRLNKPLFVADVAAGPQIAAVRAWLARHAIEVLNVAGPRETQQPGIHADAMRFLAELLSGA